MDHLRDLGSAVGKPRRDLRHRAGGCGRADQLGRCKHLAMKPRLLIGLARGFRMCGIQERLDPLEADTRGLAQFPAHDGEPRPHRLDRLRIPAGLAEDRPQSEMGKGCRARVAERDLLSLQGQPQALLRLFDMSFFQVDIGEQRVDECDPPVRRVAGLDDQPARQVGDDLRLRGATQPESHAGLYVEAVGEIREHQVKALFRLGFGKPRPGECGLEDRLALLVGVDREPHRRLEVLAVRQIHRAVGEIARQVQRKA